MSDARKELIAYIKSWHEEGNCQISCPCVNHIAAESLDEAVEREADKLISRLVDEYCKKAWADADDIRPYVKPVQDYTETRGEPGA